MVEENEGSKTWKFGYRTTGLWQEDSSNPNFYQVMRIREQEGQRQNLQFFFLGTVRNTGNGYATRRPKAL